MKTALSTRRAVAAIVASLVLGACGSGSMSESADTTAAEAPDAPAVRIVSLSPTATEMLYAIEAGDAVVAVDSLSTFPAEVADKVTDISAYEPSAEAILGFDPDIVVISNDMSKISEQLTTADPSITIWTGAAAKSLDDVYKQMTELGEVTGRSAQAAAAVQSMKDRIATATAGVKAPAGTTYFYELDNTLYSLTSATFVGSLLSQLGLDNIADGVEEGNPYPQLSAEIIIERNPTFIFLADTKCCQQNAAEVAKRAGWGDLDAVRNNRIVELDDDIASRWGPRLADLVETFAATVRALG